MTDANKTNTEGRSSRRRRNREAAAKQASSPTATNGKNRATPARRDTNKGGNFITRFFRGIANYFTSTWAELQKVTWPTRQETLRLSGIVIAVTIAFSIALGVLDYLYGELFRLGFASPVIFLIVGVILVVGVGGFTLVTRQRGGL